MREKRRSERVEFTALVIVQGEHASSFDARSCEISLSGMYLMAQDSPALREKVLLAFELPSFGGVQLPGFVRWKKSEGYGVQFSALGVRLTHAILGLVRAKLPVAAQ